MRHIGCVFTKSTDCHSIHFKPRPFRAWQIQYYSSLNELFPLLRRFLNQLVEYRPGNVKVMGSNPFEARFFFRLTYQLLNLRDSCDGHIFHSLVKTIKTIIAVHMFGLQCHSLRRALHLDPDGLISSTFTCGMSWNNRKRYYKRDVIIFVVVLGLVVVVDTEGP